MIGGLALDYKNTKTRPPENQKLATNEIRRVLRPGGIFLGAENLTGTGIHATIRNLRHKGNPGWRYLRRLEIQLLFNSYCKCVQKPYGFVGTCFSKFAAFNAMLAILDGGLSGVSPGDWFYISFIRARK